MGLGVGVGVGVGVGTVHSAVTTRLHGWRLRTTAITNNQTMLEQLNTWLGSGLG